MTLPILADATDLAQWANRRDAQGYLPVLIRRLVYATVDRIDQLSFAAGEGVQLGGWDGIVGTTEGNSHVPTGISGWELGTNRDVKGKADDDYVKRRDDPLGLAPEQTTFVFVTPRRWGNKESWAATRRSEGVFWDVRAYDADDLETWLERAAAVHTWLSRRLKYPQGAMDLEDHWEEWSKGTRPETSPALVIAGRSDVTDGLVSWLAEEGNLVYSLKAESVAH